MLVTLKPSAVASEPFFRETAVGEYGNVRGTHESIRVNVQKWDRPVRPTITREELRGAIDDVVRYNEMHGVSGTRILDRGEVVVNRKSSGGYTAKQMGCKTKGEALDRFPEVFDYVWTLGHAGYPGRGTTLETFLETKTIFHALNSASGKEEILPMEKIKIGKMRVFVVACVFFWMCSARMNQDYNSKFTEAGKEFTFPSKVGFTQSNGGHHAMAARLLKFKKTVEIDVAEFDSSEDVEEGMALTEIRYAAWNKDIHLPVEERMTDDEWWQRQVCYIIGDIVAYMRFPNSQVLRKIMGMLSGGALTTYDNTGKHELNFCYIYRRVTGKSIHDRPIPLVWFVYGDDFIGAHDEFDIDWAEQYAIFGMKLKYCNEFASPVGANFLGMGWKLIQDRYYPDFSVARVRAALQYTTRRAEKPRELLERMSGVLPLLVCYEKEYNQLRRVMLNFIRDYQIFPEDVAIGSKNLVPTYTEILRHWSGTESCGGDRPQTPYLKEYIAGKFSEKSTTDISYNVEEQQAEEGDGGHNDKDRRCEG